MGEELKLGNLFLACDDGTYVPFEGIKPTDTICVDEMDEGVYDFLPKEGTIELSFDMKCDMKRRDYRKAMKMFNAQINGYYRRKRYAIRQKEYARRRKLKGARYA